MTTHTKTLPRETLPRVSTIDLFTPKLVTVLREGYSRAAFSADFISGLTVAIVALPLSMAIAIASHATPAMGLYTAIVGGFIISALGGSRFQIGGPAGAFIVVLAAVIDRAGVEGFLLANLMAGVIIFLIGALRLGTYIKYVPHPVTVGFTSGIAIIIFSSQIKDLLGLALPGKEPAAIIPKYEALFAALPTLNPQAAGLAIFTIVVIVVLRRYRPNWPGLLIAVAVASWLVWQFGLNVETIQSRFGGIPRTLPQPTLPPISLAKIGDLLPDALVIAMLGSIESLLSAVVADSMSGRRHRSNCELVAQGLANIGCALFGGITATGTIARTATNVRAGAHGPVSGILHALFIMLFILVAAPLAGEIPLAALAGILAVVAWNMAEFAEFKSLLTASRGDAAVLLVTFGMTVFRDLAEGIVAGVTLGCLVFMHRMATAIEVETHHDLHLIEEDKADETNGGRVPYEPAANFANAPDVVIHRIAGAYFFGASSTVAATLERISVPPKGYVLDFTKVPFVDYSAAHSLHGFLKKAHKQGSKVSLTGATTHVRRELIRFGIKRPLVRYGHSIEDCVRAIRHGAEIALHEE